MSKGFKHVRHSGCRSPLMVTLLIILFVGIFFILKVPQLLPLNNEELQEFVQLINQEYDENLFNYNNVTDQDYNNLETKILNTATNSTKELVVGDTLIIDNFVSPDTTLNSQLILNGKDIACLLNLTIQQATTTEDISLANGTNINTFTISTQQSITSFSAICKIDISQLQLQTVAQLEIPSHIYITLNGQIQNTTNNYIISSEIKVNNLNETDNQKVTNYLKKLFSINDNQKFSDALIDELVRLLRVLNNTLNKNITFTSNYILIG